MRGSLSIVLAATGLPVSIPIVAGAVVVILIFVGVGLFLLVRSRKNAGGKMAGSGASQPTEQHGREQGPGAANHSKRSRLPGIPRPQQPRRSRGITCLATRKRSKDSHPWVAIILPGASQPRQHRTPGEPRRRPLLPLRGSREALGKTFQPPEGNKTRALCSALRFQI